MRIKTALLFFLQAMLIGALCTLAAASVFALISTVVRAEGDWRDRDDPNYVMVKRYYRVCDLFGCRMDWEWRKVRRSSYYGYQGYRGGYQGYGYGYNYRREDAGPECLHAMTNVSNQHQSEANAREGAIRNWQSLVRFHYGEKFIDIERARDVRFLCSQSSVADTAGSKVSEALGITHFRCELSAVPCRPNFTRGGDAK